MKKYLIKLIDGTKLTISANNIVISNDKFSIEFDDGRIMFSCTIADVQFLNYEEDTNTCESKHNEDKPREISSELIDIYLDELYLHAITTGSYHDAVIINHIKNSHVKYLPPFYTILSGRDKDKMIEHMKHMFKTLIY